MNKTFWKTTSLGVRPTVRLLEVILRRKLIPSSPDIPRRVGVVFANAQTLANRDGATAIAPRHLVAAIAGGEVLMTPVGRRVLRLSSDAQAAWDQAIKTAGGINIAAIECLRISLSPANPS